MAYKVLIPTAGTGSRLGESTKYLNKALVSIAGRPTLAHIIEMFPEDTEFVIPVGYKSELIKEFISMAYPDRAIQTVDVFPYEGEGSGLGLSILTCREYLQEPFIFCSCDTLVEEKIPAPDHNWMGYGDRENIENYRTICVDDNSNVAKICEKGQDMNLPIKPYIGLAGIFDYDIFWDIMEKGNEVAVKQGEAYGLRELVKLSMKAYFYTWYDTGVVDELQNTRLHYMVEDAPNILEKADETIWFMKNEVIKYSNNTKFIADRVKRAELLSGFVPQISGFTQHMYKYPYVPGKVMSKCVQISNFDKLLCYSKQFWKSKELVGESKDKFYEDCVNFYKNKTYERVELFYKNFDKADGTELINGFSMPTLKEMLDGLNWEEIANGLPGQFHGDFHFENIIYDDKTDSFSFLDWRQNFGKSLEVGDIYYDFSKLMHGLIVCHDLIAKDQYWVNWTEDRIDYDLNRKQILVECEKYFYKWLEQNGYDCKKVKLMTALIYLNIAALHHHPYGLMLYALGKHMLYECIYEG